VAKPSPAPKSILADYDAGRPLGDARFSTEFADADFRKKTERLFVLTLIIPLVGAPDKYKERLDFLLYAHCEYKLDLMGFRFCFWI
jgi:hypothetical protein